MMRYEIAREPHGATLIAVVSGVPAGVHVHEEAINDDVARWAFRRECVQETPAVTVRTGLSQGVTTGAPLVLELDNRAYAAAFAAEERPRRIARPGSAECVASLKYGETDCGIASDRADVRLEAMRVAAGSIAREFLAELGVEIYSCTTRIGGAIMREAPFGMNPPVSSFNIEMSESRCPSPMVAHVMADEIARAYLKGETLGGTFAVGVFGLVAGLGELSIDRRNLRSRAAASLFSIDGIAGVAFGEECQGPIVDRGVPDAVAADVYDVVTRESNRAAGVESGVSTGLPFVVRVDVAAPMPPNCSVPAFDMVSRTQVPSTPSAEKPSCCVVMEKGIVAEGEMAFVIADAYMRKFGSDSLADILAALETYKRRLRSTEG